MTSCRGIWRSTIGWSCWVVVACRASPQKTLYNCRLAASSVCLSMSMKLPTNSWILDRYY